ncbi:zinc finger protein 879-like [Condylostylus longicornis]|uniref:zinc finger protein 879-like n=1 Tax=Condylostylus longicornis TaxID=2530218 RepID=UPI00244E38AB|nr:zinc finger protein 879-like [Condylostylus longicornis]
MDLSKKKYVGELKICSSSGSGDANDSAVSISDSSEQSSIQNLSSRISSSENDSLISTTTATNISTRSSKRKKNTSPKSPVKPKKIPNIKSNKQRQHLLSSTKSNPNTENKKLKKDSLCLSKNKKSTQNLKSPTIKSSYLEERNPTTLETKSSLSSNIQEVSSQIDNNLQSAINKYNGDSIVTTSPSSKILKVKKEKKRYICHICDRNFLGITDLKRHLLVHTGEKPHKCPNCDKTFRQTVCLKNHIAAVHSNDFKFKCPKCPKKFPIKFRLRLHMRVHSGEKPYKCPKCPKTFARDGQLRQHKVTHTDDYHKCITCDEAFDTKPDLRKHMQTHIKQDHICQICMKTFSQPDLLRGHLFRIHANLKFCTICNKALKGHLSQHLKLHANEKPFTCDICEAQFSQKSQLNVHQRMHSGERPYKCQVCWQAFAHSTVLKLHIRKHTGEKPFACYLCKTMGIAFSQLAHLKTHMRTIHQTTKPYVCEGCIGFFKIKCELEKHQKKCKKYQEIKQRNENLKVTDETSSSSSPLSFDAQGIANTNTCGNIEQQKLSKLRLLIAILLKKISSEERLKQLGFEKRLIDNVVISALKLASKKYHDEPNLDELTRLRMNIEEFLKWTVPPAIMSIIRKDKNSVEELLENIVSAYPQG